jgi:hypothetical protein
VEREESERENTYSLFYYTHPIYITYLHIFSFARVLSLSVSHSRLARAFSRKIFDPTKKKEKKKLQITRAPNCICQTNTRAAQKQKFSSPRQREYEHRENTSRAFVVGFFVAIDDDEQRERRCTAAA